MTHNLPYAWKDLLEDELRKPYFGELQTKLAQEQRKYIVYPPAPDIFRAFRLTMPEDVKVVILGQDPYHGEGQANGLAFSVNRNVVVPPSLKNILRELENDTGAPPPDHGDLTKWGKQGVLLLNTVLTVRKGVPASHKHLGWQYFTDSVIARLSQLPGYRVFLLWGRHAGAKKSLIDLKHNAVLLSAHPSPFSAHRGFFGCRHFTQTNKLLKNNSDGPVDWTIEPMQR